MVARPTPRGWTAEVSFERMWRDLSPVGRDQRSGGYFRQPWASAEAELRAWFREEASARGLDLEADGVGNLIAWWDPSGRGRRGGLLTGSHLDSVLDGGAYDGPLGVVSALAALDLMRSRGDSVSTPIRDRRVRRGGGLAVRAGLPGARGWGRCDVLGQARELRDRDGTRLPDALAEAGLDPSRGYVDLSEVTCFVELHVEQGRDLVDRGAAVGVASGIWPHGRYRFDFRGEANHAGTTRMEDRHDPMLTYAMTVLAANKQARVAGQRATFGRVEVTPNGTNAVPSTVTAWLDARCDSETSLAALVEEIERQGADRAGRDGTHLTVTAESVTGAVGFDAALAARIAADHEDGDWPSHRTQAGHDAGILSAAGVPTAMLFVRTHGVSHSPAESADMSDCLTGVSALADTLVRLGR